MSDIGDRIKARRIKIGMSQAELADIVGYSTRSTIAKIEAGKIDPYHSKIVAIADALKTTPEYLMAWTDDDNVGEQRPQQPSVPKGFVPLPSMTSVPLVGNIACGTPILAEQNVEMYISVPSMWRADFALMCKGDSMAPTICDGDLVCIRSQPTVENGQIAAVLIDDEATLKRFYRHGDTVILQPENARFEPFSYTKEEINSLHIEGVAVGICRGLPEYGR